MNTLQEMYTAHDGKVSDRWTLYVQEYERLLAPLRQHPLCMLEIGIQNGGSLEIWARYFANARSLVGCDINPDCARLQYDDPRVTVIVADANTDATQERVRAISPVLDLVIDDGSHTSRDIVHSFGRYFPMLSEQGIFIAEDLHCGYWKDFEGGLFDPTSSISFFKALADIVNHEHWGMQYARARLLEPFRARFGVDLGEDQLAEIHSVEFINSICVVRKAPAARNVLGPRVVTAGVEQVVHGHHPLRGSTIERFDQSNNALASVENFPPEAIPALRAEVEQLRSELQDERNQLQDVRNQLQHARAELAAIRDSRSWRYTAWLRRLREGGQARHG